MKLSYRGNQYQSETALLEVRESDITGKYRGSKWSYKLPRHIPQLQPKLDLKYRGIAYSSRPNLHIKPYFSSEEERASSSLELTLSQVTEKNLTDIHLENLRLNLERRIKVAQENENYHLLAMLQKESQQLLQYN